MPPVMRLYFLWIIVLLGICSVHGQGISLTAGTSVRIPFSAMQPSSNPMNGSAREGFQVEGLFSPTPAGTYSFKLELFNSINAVQPIAIYDFPPYTPQGNEIASFGVADWGTFWKNKSGAIALTYVSGPPTRMTFLAAYQSIFGPESSALPYEAILVPEPTSVALLLIPLSVFLATLMKRSSAAAKN